MIAARKHPATQVLALGTAQVVAWGSSTYLPAMISGPICATLGLSQDHFFAAFSLSLVVMAMLGPRVGRAIDRQGGQRILCLSNVVLAIGLLMLSMANNAISLFVSWCVLGIGMASGLYDAAFAALVRQHGKSASGMIVGVSLVGGFASTVGWPLSMWMVNHWGWRACCQCWAFAHLAFALPLHWNSFRRSPVGPLHQALAAPAAEPPRSVRPASDMPWLIVFSGTTAFVTSAMAAHLPNLLRATGSSPTQALVAATLLGPAQVAARLFEYALARRYQVHPLSSARTATVLHPAACLLLGSLGAIPIAGAMFAMLHGAGNGMISVARGVLPLRLFGPQGYGAITGRLALFGRSAQAMAPSAFALVLGHAGAELALVLSGLLSSIGLFALFRLRH